MLKSIAKLAGWGLLIAGGIGAVFALLAFLTLSTISLLLTSILDPPAKHVEILSEAKPRDIASGRYAVVLRHFATGRGDVLIRDPEDLQRLRPLLWYKRESNVGSWFGSAIGLTMGAPPRQEVATLYRDGIPVEDFDCLSLSCLHWPQAEPSNADWGMGPLRADRSFGEPLKSQHEKFTDYESYLVAHAAALAAGDRWVQNVSDATPEPYLHASLRITITLPSQILDFDPGLRYATSPPDERLDAASAATLREVEPWTEGLDIPSPHLSDSHIESLGIEIHGEPVGGANGYLKVPDTAVRHRELTYFIDPALLDPLMERIAKTPIAAPDHRPLREKALKALAEQKLLPDCAPDCVGISLRGLASEIHIQDENPRKWTITTWRVATGI